MPETRRAEIAWRVEDTVRGSSWRSVLEVEAG